MQILFILSLLLFTTACKSHIEKKIEEHIRTTPDLNKADEDFSNTFNNF